MTKGEDLRNVCVIKERMDIDGGEYNSDREEKTD